MEKEAVMKYSNWILGKRDRGFVLIIFFVFVIQGCAAPLVMPAYTALSAASIGVSGFGVYKATQLTTGGEAEVRFAKKDLSSQDKDALASIKSIIVYPGGQEKVRLAELLSESDYKIITPHAVTKTLSKKEIPVDFSQLTKKEKISYACQLCKIFKADGMFVFSCGGTETDTKMWSFGRPEVSTKFQLQLFSHKYKKVIWDQKGKLVVKGGSKFPSYKETEGLLISALAKKFFEDTAKI